MGGLFRALAVVALTTAALGACNPDEQGRPLTLEKGVYRGAPDMALSDAQRAALRQRTSWQGQ